MVALLEDQGLSKNEVSSGSPKESLMSDNAVRKPYVVPKAPRVVSSLSLVNAVFGPVGAPDGTYYASYT